MKVLFRIFGIPVHFFGVMIVVGMLAGIFVAYKEAKRKKLDIDKLFDIILYSIIAAIISARLSYVLFYNPMYYLENPIEIFKIYEGGLSIHGGLLAAFAFGLIYLRKHKLNFFNYADAIAPGVILGQGIGRIGCDVFGKSVSWLLPWGIQYGGKLVHPAQVYEFILDYLVFFVLWRKRKKIQYDGQVFLWYIILFSINRGIVEFFRTNPSVWGWFSISHLLSASFIFGALILMYFIKKGAYGSSNHSEVTVEQNSSLAKDILFCIGLIVVSIVIYYAAWM